ncbi:MAG: tRNA pseudouridine(13) synthase TruD [Planctomycetes bacterium]|nr:tRNA pseudouridine(13) synthase TruD [Planctomycetota bacterium]
MDLPHLTDDLPGIGGRIKQRVEDFRVEEIPLYDACGEGTHVYFRVEKAGIPTAAAVEKIARHMAVRPGDIGVAGLKDARAITVQMMSLEHADPQKLLAFSDRGARITWTSRHTNKLRPGHLAGNRFTIRIRGVGESQLPAAERVLAVEMDCTWVDVGSWPALESVVEADTDGNVSACENVVHLGSRGNIVVAETDHLIATIGVDDLVIVHAPDATLICKKRDAQGIKELVDNINQRYGDRYK